MRQRKKNSFRRTGARVGGLGLLLAISCVAQSPVDSQFGDVPEGRIRLAGLEPAEQFRLQTAMQKHDYAAAETLLAAHAQSHPKSQPALLLLADVLFLDGKQLNSVVVLKKAELLSPLDERSRYLLALSYVSLGRRNLAIPELEKLAEFHPTDARYPYWLARLLYRKMDLQHALSYAREAVRLNPALAKAHDQLGLCYAALGEADSAIQSYRDAIRLSEEQALHWPWPALNLGTLYFRLDRLPEAEQALNQSLLAEPNFPAAHFRLGQVLEKTGQLDRAILELLKAAELDPTYPEPHYALARIYRRRKDLTAADRELSAFARLREIDNQKGIVRPD